MLSLLLYLEFVTPARPMHGSVSRLPPHSMLRFRIWATTETDSERNPSDTFARAKRWHCGKVQRDTIVTSAAPSPLGSEHAAAKSETRSRSNQGLVAAQWPAVGQSVTRNDRQVSPHFCRQRGNRKRTHAGQRQYSPITDPLRVRGPQWREPPCSSREMQTSLKWLLFPGQSRTSPCWNPLGISGSPLLASRKRRIAAARHVVRQR
jgi:hypothetical protein